MSPAILYRCLMVLLLVLQTAIVQAQTLANIPQVNLSFFKGPVPKNSSFASMTFIDYSYRFAIEQNTRTGEVKVKLAVNIDPNSSKSFLDSSRVRTKDQIQRLLDHERGHIVLGYIIGRQIENDLNAIRYTRNYQQEIRSNYKRLYSKYEKLQLAYDKETGHGSDLQAQEKWNKKIAKLAKT